MIKIKSIEHYTLIDEKTNIKIYTSLPIESDQTYFSFMRFI